MSQLLLASGVEEISDDGISEVEFEFSYNFKWMIQRSDCYARVNLGVLLALQSRYALTLYDLGCLIINRQNRVVKMAVDELGRRLGVPEGSFKNFAKLFRRDVLAKSKAEIDHLADFAVEWEEIRGLGRGRSLKAVKLTFSPKDPAQQDETARELDRPRIRPQARRDNAVETQAGPSSAPALARPARRARSAERRLFPSEWLHYCGNERLLAIVGDFGGGWDKDLIADAYRKDMGAKLETLAGPALYESGEGFCKRFVRVRGKA